jgi:hypothetical protein
MYLDVIARTELSTALYPTQIKTAFETSLVRTETREYDFRSGVVTRVTA